MTDIHKGLPAKALPGADQPGQPRQFVPPPVVTPFIWDKLFGHSTTGSCLLGRQLARIGRLP